MFITKKKFEKAIKEAVAKAENEVWKMHEERNANNYIHERIDRIANDFDKRVLVLEKLAGVVKEPHCCCCHKEENEKAPTPIGF